MRNLRKNSHSSLDIHKAEVMRTDIEIRLRPQIIIYIQDHSDLSSYVLLNLYTFICIAS